MTAARIRDLNLHRRYFDLTTAGEKSTCEEQLAYIRTGYPPEEEALGALAIGIGLLAP
ncbi:MULTISPECIES: hypothetical protein [Streptomyces]|uniref:hypothetical protein n=1 Tax=Streptomyces TaxID=1883 RepID=UPI0013EF8A14|nr:hypothetical protein [Streptomyces kasugaensis]